jgi:hypothetical protein
MARRVAIAGPLIPRQPGRRARALRPDGTFAGDVRAPNEPGVGLDEIELGPLRVEQAAGRLDDLLEEVAGIPDRGDPGGDLAQRLFGSGPPPDLLARAGEGLDEPGVLDRDRGLVGERLDEGDLIGLEGAGLRPADLEDAEQAFLAGHRGHDQGADGVLTDRLVEPRIVLEAGVGHVVGADHGPAGRDRLARRPVLERPAVLVDGGPADDVAGARDMGEADPAGRGDDEVDPGAGRAEEPGGLVDDVLEQVGRVADRGDPGGDLAECPLGVGLPAGRGPGAIQLLDEAGVRHRDRGLAGERLDDVRVVLVERILLRRVDGQRAERPAIPEEGNRDDRPDRVLPDVLVGCFGMLEAVVVQVVAGEDRSQLADRPTGDPLPRLGLAASGDGPEARPPAGRGVVRPVEAAGGLVEDVDPGSVCAEQPRRLVDRPLEDLLGVAEGDDPAADLAQRALRIRPALDVRPRAAELLDEVGVGHRRRGMVRQGPDERDLRVAQGVDSAGERPHRPERPAAADEGGHDERMDREVGDEPVRVGEVDERGVVRVVAGPGDLACGDGPAEQAHADLELERADPRPAAVVGDPGVVGETEDALGVEEIGHGPVRAKQSGSLLDRALEDRMDVGRRRSGRRGRRA